MTLHQEADLNHSSSGKEAGADRLRLRLFGLYRRISETSIRMSASGRLGGRQAFSLIRRASAMQPETRRHCVPWICFKDLLLDDKTLYQELLIL